jgi:hypothetical protein
MDSPEATRVKEFLHVCLWIPSGQIDLHLKSLLPVLHLFAEKI